MLFSGDFLNLNLNLNLSISRAVPWEYAGRAPCCLSKKNCEQKDCHGTQPLRSLECIFLAPYPSGSASVQVNCHWDCRSRDWSGEHYISKLDSLIYHIISMYIYIPRRVQYLPLGFLCHRDTEKNFEVFQGKVENGGCLLRLVTRLVIFTLIGYIHFH